MTCENMPPNYITCFIWVLIVRRVHSAGDVLSCFEKTPDHALIGYAQDIGSNKVDSLEECLQQCVDSVKKYSFQCKSTLFYPDLKECNLNTATKADDSFSFVATATGEKVDYYEYTCGAGGSSVQTTTPSSEVTLSSSPTTTTSNNNNNNNNNNGCFQKTAGKSISGVADNIVQGTMAVDQCQQECTNAQIKYKIKCRSILWFEEQKGCLLMTVIISEVPTQVVDDPGIDYYENICFVDGGGTTALPRPTPSIPSATPPTTGGNNTGLRVPRIIACFQKLPVQTSMTEDRIFPVTSVDQCADVCLFCNACLFGQRCNMVAYAISNGHCALSRSIGQPSGLNDLGDDGGGNILFYARGKC